MKKLTFLNVSHSLNSLSNKQPFFNFFLQFVHKNFTSVEGILKLIKNLNSMEESYLKKDIKKHIILYIWNKYLHKCPQYQYYRFYLLSKWCIYLFMSSLIFYVQFNSCKSLKYLFSFYLKVFLLENWKIAFEWNS